MEQSPSAKDSLKTLLEQLFVNSISDRSQKSISLTLGIDAESPDILMSTEGCNENKEAKRTAVASFMEKLDSHPHQSITLHDLASFLECDATFLEKSIDFCEPQSKILSSLDSTSDKDVQKTLRESWFGSTDTYCCVFDSYANNFGAPFYSIPSSEAVKSNSGMKMTNSAKPNFSSLAVSMFLELKGYSQEGLFTSEGCAFPANAYEVLLQAMERVWMCASLNELLTRVFVFATTGSKSWLVSCKRRYLNRDPTSENPILLSDCFHVVPIDTNLIIPTWRAITKQALENASYYLHQDAYFLKDTLSHMGLNLAYCRTKILAVSDATVYGISPNESISDKLMQVSSLPAFAIKVHKRSSRGSVELEMLRRLMGCKQAAKYVLGTFSYSGESGHKLKFEDFLVARQTAEAECTKSSSKRLPSDSTSALTVFACKKGCYFSFSEASKKRKFFVCNLLPNKSGKLTHPWWTFTRRDAAGSKPSSLSKNKRVKIEEDVVVSRATAVLMHVGSKGIEWRNEYKTGLYTQLNEIHSRYVFHTDIRPANLLGFDFSGFKALSGRKRSSAEASHLEFCIIDFDFTVHVESKDISEGVEIDISLPGTRSEIIRDIVPTNDDSAKMVQWTAIQECVMLSKSFDQLKREAQRSSGIPVKAPQAYAPYKQTVYWFEETVEGVNDRNKKNRVEYDS